MTVFTASEGLQMAMEIEQSGELFYKAAAERTTDAEVQQIFTDLAAQEQGHYRLFQKMLREAKPAPPLSAAEYDQYDIYVQSALEHALFAGPDKALSLAHQAQDRESALRAALGFEKDTLLFFYDLRDMVNAADQDTITAIINEEKKHLRRLAELLRGAGD